MTIYTYTPKDDITVKELSSIVQVLFVSLIEAIQQQPIKGSDDLEVDESVYNNLPEDLKGHFVLSDNQTPKT